MEQMYLIEIFIDKITVFVADEEEFADNNFILKVKFGPKVEFIIKEGQLAVKKKGAHDDIIETDALGRKKRSRTIRVGKSYLFPSYPDTILITLSKFPLKFDLFTDRENEVEIFVGIGMIIWDTNFFHMLKENTDVCKSHQPLSIKQSAIIFAECCCKQVGEIDVILRLSALGESIITEFQQLLDDPDCFVFRTNKAPSMFHCKKIEGDDPNFCMTGSLYESATLEDPTTLAAQRIEICTDVQSCANVNDGGNVPVTHSHLTNQYKPEKVYPIDKIRMGDISGPCGNTNCPLAHKIKTYIRNMDAYKNETKSQKIENVNKRKKVCGACICKDDRYHRGICVARRQVHNKVSCTGCKGLTNEGETCLDEKNKMFGTGATPKSSKTNEKVVAYAYSMQNLNCLRGTKSSDTVNCSGYSSNQVMYEEKSRKLASQSHSTGSLQNANVYSFQVSESQRKFVVLNCLEVTKDCKCSPPKPHPPCKTTNCDCITETENIAKRKVHKPYCPSYKHKNNCPVTLMNEENEVVEDENEIESLPYGVPPIKLGPCPVLGRPCIVPDGFARMYKNALLPPLPPSYSEAGKVCCSKEFERIRNALKEYMKHEKESDLRCINQFNTDIERRCCDKDQRLQHLMGKTCCGLHKMEIHEKFKENKPS